jgi:hypothetical protein
MVIAWRETTLVMELWVLGIVYLSLVILGWRLIAESDVGKSWLEVEFGLLR